MQNILGKHCSLSKYTTTAQQMENSRSQVLHPTNSEAKTIDIQSLERNLSSSSGPEQMGLFFLQGLFGKDSLFSSPIQTETPFTLTHLKVLCKGIGKVLNTNWTHTVQIFYLGHFKISRLLLVLSKN